MPTACPQDGQSPPQPAQTDKGRQRIIYIGIVAAIGIIVILFLMDSNVGGSSTTTILPQSNSAPIYMSPSEAQVLLGSPIINYSYNYSATSIYNFSFPLNITFLEAVEPAFSGNVTNGWVTAAFGSGPNNASMQYFAIQTANASNMSARLAQDISSLFATLPSISNGAYGGMNYTYETYSNSTGSYQSLVGWKDGYVAFAQIEANSFTANQTQIAEIVSNTIP